MSGSIELHRRATAAAATQGGVVSRHQLVDILGWTDNAVRTQLDAKRWQRVFDGVYAVTTGDLGVESLWWAAHLRCGPASALSGESALQAWGIRAPGEPIEVAVPITASARTPGLVIHRSRHPTPARNPRGLPPTVLPQIAVLMVSNRLDAAGVMDLVSSANQKGRVSADQLERAMRTIRVKHRKLIVELLAEIREGSTTPLEIPGVRRILKAHRLPTGHGQVRERINGAVAIRDRLILGLIIEFDGRLGHADPRGRLRDLDRDNTAALTGRPTLRFGWTDVHENPCRAADQVVEALTRLGADIDPVRCSSGCRSRLFGSDRH